ncbi:hypothetical protein BGX21_000602 [Mortierella sp. AD011]|nr:hypothetical protein BGX20_003753 [Mortierella sp. AD010]KAF9387331.1 hypothetical protein BGX21_000602 [Mortierella sp. AD011]
MFETTLRDTETAVSHCALKIFLPANGVQIQAITTTSDSVKNGCAMPDVIFPRAPIGIFLSSTRSIQWNGDRNHRSRLVCRVLLRYTFGNSLVRTAQHFGRLHLCHARYISLGILRRSLELFPILSAHLFQENGSYYDINAVTTNRVVNEEKIRSVCPVRIDSFFPATYCVNFAGLTATVVHGALYHGPEVVSRWKSSHSEDEGINSRLTRAYPEVPKWWYSILFIITLVLSFITCCVWDFMPWWGVILAPAIAVFFVLPVDIVQVVTNQAPGLNIVAGYVIGYILPGHAIVNVIFKTYGYITNVQALTCVSDLKIGHYMKIPPHIMFFEQGAIGLPRVFGNKDGALYSKVQWGFLVGTASPAPFLVRF